MKTAALQIDVRRGPKFLLRQVSARFAPGTFTAVVGPNGAGKTTLLRVLAGDCSPDGGHVLLGPRVLSTLQPRELARCRAVLPQHSELRFGFSVGRIVELGRLPWDEPRATTVAHRQRALERVGLTSMQDRSWLTLSGGERQRVQIARVLAQVATMESGLVLLDEPTNHLDLAHQVRVLDLGRQLARQGATVIAVLHDLTFAARVADQVLLLADGGVVAHGPPAQVLVPTVLAPAFGVPVRLLHDPEEAVRLPLPCLETP